MPPTYGEYPFDTAIATKGVDRDAEHDTGKSLRRLSRLAGLLDDRYGIPGTNVRFGLDAIVGLVPGIGDLAGAALSGYIVLESRRLGVPKRLLLTMLKNIAVDAALGAVPIIGDLADIQWKANRKNVHLVIDHLDDQRRSRPLDAVPACMTGR